MSPTNSLISAQVATIHVKTRVCSKMARSVMWAIALLAVAAVVPSAQAGWSSWVPTYTTVNTTIVSSINITIPAWVSCPTCTYVYVLPTTTYCGGCPGSYSCCHVGTYLRPSYQCLTLATPVVPVTPCTTCTKPAPKPCKKCAAPKPAPAPKPVTVVSSYCKCGTGSACCKLGSNYKCVPVYVPKPVKCGRKSCSAGFFCASSGKWWKRSKCARVEYTHHVHHW